jgi:hypothetical protein
VRGQVGQAVTSGRDEDADTLIASTPLFVGILGNAVLLAYVIYGYRSLFWVAGLLGLGLALFLIEHFSGAPEPAAGSRTR